MLVRSTLCTLVSCLMLLVITSASANAAHGVSGTFLQPSATMESWSTAQWNTLFDSYEEAGAQEIIVQWLDYSDSYTYCEEEPCGYDPALLQNIFHHAHKRGMRVTLGTIFLSSFWERVKAKPHLVEVHLMRIRVGTRRSLAKLAPLLRTNSTFAGWYISQEIDDRTWFNEAYKDMLCTFIGEIHDDLQNIAAGPISISTFCNGWASPKKVADFWQDVATRTPLSRILFQDSIGAQKLQIRDVPLYLRALQTSLIKTNCRVQPVVEIFTARQGAHFSAHPAPLKRILRQLQATRPYAPQGAILFSVAEYMSPIGGTEAAQLLKEFTSAPPAE